MEQQDSQIADEDTGIVSQTVEGSHLVDGQEVPVKVTFRMDGIERGAVAYDLLVKGNESLKEPVEEMEYIIVTFKVSYDAGEADEIFMSENRGSLESGRLYFALSNRDSNGEDVTQ